MKWYAVHALFKGKINLDSLHSPVLRKMISISMSCFGTCGHSTHALANDCIATFCLKERICYFSFYYSRRVYPRSVN
jgi:hypothetical protein